MKNKKRMLHHQRQFKRLILCNRPSQTGTIMAIRLLIVSHKMLSLLLRERSSEWDGLKFLIMRVTSQAEAFTSGLTSQTLKGR